jgi:ankyrin repeat protein
MTPPLERIAAGRTDLVFELDDSALRSAIDGAPPIRWCAYYGDVSAIRHLLSRGVDLLDLGENLDLTGAAFHGHWRLCAFALERGADPRLADPTTGETPLHAAVSVPGRPRHAKVVEVLLAAGADPNRRCALGAETGAFMRDVRTRGETPLHRAAAFASVASIERLLAAGGDRTAIDAHGDTPLSWASWHCRPDAVLRLLCHGPHRLHPARDSRADHGHGVSAMDENLDGKPTSD